MADNDFVVGGYHFETEEEYNEALREKNGIKYLSTQIDLNDYDKLEKVYDDLVARGMFHTPVGLGYLERLKAEIDKHKKDNPQPKARIEVIKTATESDSVEAKEEKAEDKPKKKASPKDAYVEKLDTEIRKLKSANRNLIIVVVILLLMVIAMFIISSTTSNANIINYERVITDRYASWAEELNKKEEELRDREHQLERRESEQESASQN